MPKETYSFRYDGMVRDIGKDLVPTDVSEEKLLQVAEQLYVTTNGVINLEEVPEALRSPQITYQLAHYKGRVAALNGVMIILGQEEFVVANEYRTARIREERDKASTEKVSQTRADG